MDLKSINKLKKTYEAWTAIGLVLVVISFIGFMGNPIMAIGFLGGGLISAISGAKFKKLSTEFKSIHVKKIIEQEITDVFYDPKEGFDRETVYASKILKKEDRYYSEDYLSGHIKGKKFESADVKLQDVRRNGKHTTVVTVFQGRFFIIDFDKKFESDVYIMPNRSFTFNWANSMVRIDLESMEFNKTFDVYSYSQHSAFYLLKPAFIEKLIEFNHVAKRVMFAFQDQKAYVALDTRVDTFDLKMFREIDSTFFEDIKKEIKMLEELIELIP
jgi:uncharacterized protein DUF3137